MVNAVIKLWHRAACWIIQANIHSYENKPISFICLQTVPFFLSEVFRLLKMAEVIANILFQKVMLCIQGFMCVACA